MGALSIALLTLLSDAASTGHKNRGQTHYKIAKIDGSVGGKLRLGRFEVTVPAGAYKGRATITLKVNDPSAKECHVDISPANANKFAIPVTLTANVADAPKEKQEGLEILYFDQKHQVWTAVPGSQFDPATGVVTAPLYHFSIYGVGSVLEGRSGW